MKKILTLIVMVILTVMTVSADKVGSLDDECRQFGFDYGLVKWQCDDSLSDAISAQVLNFWSLDSEFSDDLGTSVEGTCDTTYWDVGSSGATGIVVKGGQIDHGGYWYSIRATDGWEEDLSPSISHITFCGDDPDDEIPEFGVIGAVAVLGLAGLFIHRRRK